VTVARGLDQPWGLAFLPDGSMLVTERPGRLRRVTGQGALSAPIEGVPGVDARGQGGLLDVALDPEFPRNRWVYLSYSEPGTGAEAGWNGTAVARAALSPDQRRLERLQVIFRQSPKRRSTAHFGSRLVFRRDGTLLITLGERQAYRDEAQNPASHLGKVVRINSDGSVPLDNPFLGRSGYAPELWSLGHRNVQGAALDPGSGELWTTEHGPQGGDELNLTRAGRNYGWPRISYGCEYGSPVGDCVPVGGASAAPGLEQPAAYWVPVSIAPSGLAFNTGDRYPGWRGQLFLGALAGKALWRVELRDGQVVAREALLQDLGERIRDVRQGPDGWLYLLTDSGSGRILRVER
jgi:aldose sugar dehydrogenase